VFVAGRGGNARRRPGNGLGQGAVSTAFAPAPLLNDHARVVHTTPAPSRACGIKARGVGSQPDGAGAVRVTQLPRQAGVAKAGERRCARPAVVAGDEDVVRAAFTTAMESTPSAPTSFTLTEAAVLAFRRSKMSWIRSSTE
jgi:hypothetical protein